MAVDVKIISRERDEKCILHKEVQGPVVFSKQNKRIKRLERSPGPIDRQLRRNIKFIPSNIQEI